MTALGETLARSASHVCRAWIVERRDGVVMGFTDHDGALVVDGVPCRADTGLTAGALQMATGLAVDNAEASGALCDASISDEDIRAGKWDAAKVTSYLVDWRDPNVFEITFRGFLGEITWGDGAFAAELRGQAELLNQVRGRLYQSRCDAVLGDDRCRKDLGPLFSVEVDVAEVVENTKLSLEPLRDFSPKWFQRGRMVVLTGSAAGMSERIKFDRGDDTFRLIELWASVRADIRAGDRIRIEAGCDKRQETCRLKFDNLINFRGFPSIPGDDWLMAYPKKTQSNDGGRL
ncbi:DUF2163 domain-containing protein [Jannaschia pohangensis]|uniref:Bacteriophage phiJL001 Gp84 C-terminal domain-containing protein n=1 Tax=Jannaschia pohangensis TaxID=390807 RepID=A0A1I3HRL8_9RHOB|nr:DUF2163 domain-containing protein [Jannaschia pohangensis]SFI38301.1 phage conserved hypothetical protein BR0599 [Jannaschia pohangensis]